MLDALYIGLKQGRCIAVRERGGACIQVIMPVAFAHDVYKKHRCAQAGADEERPCREVGLFSEEIRCHRLASGYEAVARKADHPLFVNDAVDFEYVRQIITDHDKTRLGFGHDVGEVRLDGPLFFIGRYQMNLFVKFAHEILGHLKIPYMGADQDTRTIVFCQLADMIDPIELICVFMLEARSDGNFIDKGLPENEIIPIGVGETAKETVLVVETEISVYGPRLTWRKQEVIQGNENKQDVGDVYPYVLNQENKYFVSGNCSPRFSFPFGHWM